MPIQKLNTVRLTDACIASGFELLFVNDQAALTGMTLLPDLMRRLETKRSRECPAVRCCVEVAVACTGNKLCAQLRHGLNVRLRFPPDSPVSDVSVLCQSFQKDTLSCLNEKGMLCRPIDAYEEGIVHLIPPLPTLHFLTKERRVGHLSNAVCHYSPRFSITEPVKFSGVFNALKPYPGCGLCVQIFPEDDPSFCSTLVQVAMGLSEADARAEIMQIAQASARYTVQAVLFSPSTRSSDEASRELHGTLNQNELPCRAWTSQNQGEMQRYQLLYDPWSLNAWIRERIGGRLAATATVLCDTELAALTGNQTALSEQIPISMGLTLNELAAFGVNHENGLAEKGIPQDQIEQMSAAASLARFALENESLPSLVSYATPLGILYEMFVRAYIENRLFKAENLYREKNIPSFKPYDGEIQLSNFDYISYGRVENYRNHVRFGAEPLPALCWAVWFNCFKCVRLMRNKVHAHTGEVTREELKLMYHLLFFQGYKHKLNALRYAIAHPHPDADDDKGKNLKIRHPQRDQTTDDLLRYIADNPALFEESMLFFIRRCAEAQWI